MRPAVDGRIIPPMLNIVSILVGIVALLGALVAFIPFLGAANWLLIPIALVGAGIGALPVTLRRSGPGHWTADTLVLSPGVSWRIGVRARVSEFDEHAAMLTVPVR